MWSKDDIYGYKSALNDSRAWCKVSENLEDFHGTLEKDENAEFSTKWFYVVYQKV